MVEVISIQAKSPRRELSPLETTLEFRLYHRLTGSYWLISKCSASGRDDNVSLVQAAPAGFPRQQWHAPQVNSLLAPLSLNSLNLFSKKLRQICM